MYFILFIFCTYDVTIYYFYVVYNEMHNFTVFLLFKLAGQDLIIYIVL